MAQNAIQLKVIFNRIPEMSGEVKRKGEALVAETARKVATDAARRAPVRTGRLRNGIRPDVNGLAGFVTSEAPYSHFVEYGTSRMGAKPFMWPAVEAARPDYLAAWRALLAGSGQRSGSVTVVPGRATTFRRSGGTAPR